ncbi:MAG: hypothetical protein KDC88_05690, partial [Ignavibacteriae bacterium]|nr:hypothetical protein [Ignavibacteriota bacterium]
KRRTKETQTGIFTETFKLNFDKQKVRYVKVKTNSLINCPVWHIGHNHGNGKAFIFIDEIIVE